MRFRIRLEQPSTSGEGSPSKPFMVETAAVESKEDQTLKVLLNEVADVTRAMRELLMTADRFINFAGVIAAGTLTLGVINHDDGKNGLALIFAPYGIALAFGYLLQVYTEVEKRAGYKAFLEERINGLMGYPVLLESHVNSAEERSRLSGLGMQVINFAGLVSFCVLGLRETGARYGKDALLGVPFLNYHTINVVFLLVAGATVFVAILENRRAGEQARKKAEESLAAESARMSPSP
jgi:hypothetical protein